MTFTIDTDHNVTAHAGNVAAREDQVAFATQQELAQATANWSTQQLVALWNSFAGVAPFGDLKRVKKFENRGIATKRIWETIQKLAPANPEPELPSEDDMLGKSKSKANKEAKGGAQGATKRKSKAVAEPKTGDSPAAPEGSRKETVLNLIARKHGATLAELMEATGWQPHSVRGFISTLQSKHGVAITSSKNEAGERVYQAAR
jgi:Protein of unknown function (DUF3489)